MGSSHYWGEPECAPHYVLSVEKSQFQSWSMSACTSRVVRLLQVILILGSC